MKKRAKERVKERVKKREVWFEHTYLVPAHLPLLTCLFGLAYFRPLFVVLIFL
jgi:hypothetical protein